MEEPPTPDARLFVACGFGGALATLMGVLMWVGLLRGERVYYRNAHAYLSSIDSALIATAILAVGLGLVWIAHKGLPPRR